MSLKVWLPLNGDLRNLGTSNYNVSAFRGSVVYNDNGKLGKCFYSNGVNTLKIENIIQDFYNYNAYSLCAWIYVEAQNTSHTGSGIISGGNWNSQVLNLALSDWSSDHYTKLRISGTSWRNTYSYNFYKNTWYHIIVSSDGNKTYGYVNGVSIGNTAPGFLPTNIEGTNIAIGGASYYAGMQFFGRICDVRIYDHCLSKLEIKELSQGLVCHYKFDNIYNTNNLILNGNGELGSKHWNTPANMSTDDLPSDQPLIKAKYWGNTNEYIEICKHNLYTISCYIKSRGSTSGSTYPSIYPYDYDKKFIGYPNCATGFSSAYKTTLAQPLKNGDTVIHATDLSAWTTGNNYWNYVAIFGYRDSSGFTYPDMQYTADSPAFATNADKSHLDKENNTITLNAAFTGEDRPAGTVICQATAGSTYYYPFGAVAYSTIQDWVFKTATFIPYNEARLRWARYIRWNTYSGANLAGNTLIDNTWHDNIINDESGNGYDAIINSTLLIDSESPRYTYSTRFPLNTSYCRVTFPSVTGFADSYTFSWWGKSVSTNTMMWGFANGNRLNLFLVNPVCWNTGDSSNNPFAGVSPITDNKFHYYTITGDGATTKLYIDGEFRANAKTYKGITGTTLYFNGWDTSTKYKFCGCLSDFKLFATVLSADDIKRVYEEAVSVGKLGDAHPYEIVESNTVDSITKTGVFSNEVFSENYITEVSKYDNNLYIEPDGAVFIRISHQARPTTKIFSSSDNFVNGVYLDSDRWACLSIMNDCTSWEFMVKQKPESTSTEQIYRWTQQVNPITGTYEDVAPANVVFNSNSRYIIGAYKGGVYKSNINAFLVQNNGIEGNWWGAICAWARHSNGLPGFGGANVVKTGYLDLYIRIDNQFKLGDSVFKKYKHNNTWYSPCIIEK